MTLYKRVPPWSIGGVDVKGATARRLPLKISHLPLSHMGFRFEKERGGEQEDWRQVYSLGVSSPVDFSSAFASCHSLWLHSTDQPQGIGSPNVQHGLPSDVGHQLRRRKEGTDADA